MAAPRDENLGRTLGGRFALEARIGRGGMARVYRATDRSSGEPVAVKILHTTAIENPKVAQRFIVEAEVAAKLEHPNIPKIFGFGRDPDGYLYLAMELLEGQSLRERLEEGPLSARATLRLVRDVVAALDVAHRRGVVHRDVKPENIFLPSGGGTKLLDFGIARLTEGPSQTTKGKVWGSVAYMSPEQARGRPIGPASDLYSLGVVAFECLTGTPPFDTGGTVAMMLKQIHDPVPPVGTLVEVPPEVEALVAAMVAKRPAERPESAHEVLRTVQGLLGEALAPTPLEAGEVLETKLSGPRDIEPTRVADSLELGEEAHERTALAGPPPVEPTQLATHLFPEPTPTAVTASATRPVGAVAPGSPWPRRVALAALALTLGIAIALGLGLGGPEPTVAPVEAPVAPVIVAPAVGTPVAGESPVGASPAPEPAVDPSPEPAPPVDVTGAPPPPPIERRPRAARPRPPAPAPKPDSAPSADEVVPGFKPRVK